jgi:hypothetical protein
VIAYNRITECIEARCMEIDHYENFPVARAWLAKAPDALMGWLAVSVQGNA